MKRKLLFAASLLAGTLTAQAQLPPCGMTLTKSGTGMTRTYTATANATSPQYSINIFSNAAGLINSGTTTSVTHTYTQPGYYYVYASVMGSNCNDSAFLADTVVGTLNCNMLTHSMSASGSGATFWFYRSGSATGSFPYFTSATTYSYGDGTTGTANNHTYTASGSYLVTATTVLSSSNYGSCTVVDTVTVRATVSGSTTFNCANVNAAFSYTGTGATYNFTNQTTNQNTAPATVSYLWNFGDGTISSTTSPGHNYTQSGTYTVRLVATWTGNGMVLCRDTAYQSVTVVLPPAPNVITASANWDSSINAAGASVKMWLIQYDSSTQTLTAVDSALIPVQANVPYVVRDFAGKPAGQYRVKAHMINQPSSWTTGFLPTYSYNAAYWANAAVINHTGATVYANTWLQQGLPMTGPGFISGNVLQGANRGAAVGDPMGNITILLRNNTNNQLVASTETDANGTYTFTNVPVGSYNVYPEELNYATTPSAPIQITANNTNSTTNDFWRETVAKTLHPITPSGVKAVQQEGQILISPNPAKDLLSIQFATAPQKGSTVQLYNLSGQLVKAFPIADAQTTQQLSLSGVAAGAYLLHIPTQKGTQVARITVQD